MNLTTATANLRTAAAVLPRPETAPGRWETSSGDSVVLSAAPEIASERLSLSQTAQQKMAATQERFGQLAGLSARLTGAQVERTPNHATADPRQPDPELRQRALAAVRQRELARYSHIEAALSGGAPTTFTNGEGRQVEYSLRQNKDVGEHSSYTVEIGRHQVEVQLPQGEDRVLGLGKVTDFFSQQPENLRGAVDTVRIESGPNPSNTYWAEKYNQADFKAAATGGGGTITYYEGLTHLVKRTFDHEYAHNIGEAVRKEQDREAKAARKTGAVRRLDRETGDAQGHNFPRGYSQALQADNQAVSNYGDHAPGEDFAEFYAAYRSAAGKGEVALQEFTEKYPHRSRLLRTEVLSRELTTAP
jgi:hypothetical protein